MSELREQIGDTLRRQGVYSQVVEDAIMALLAESGGRKVGMLANHEQRLKDAEWAIEHLSSRVTEMENRLLSMSPPTVEARLIGLIGAALAHVDAPADELQVAVRNYCAVHPKRAKP